MKAYRVIQWGTGYAGIFALKYILNSADLELVGVRCYTREKDGVDAGTIAGVEAVGVRATTNVKELLALKADCVVFMPRDFLTDPSAADSPARAWVEELAAILESGANVITPICSGTHWRHLSKGEEFKGRLDAACKKGDTTVHFSGFDPGFTTDALAFMVASVVGDIQQLRTWEIIDVSTYTSIPSLQGLGFGARPQDLPAAGANAITIGWGGAIHVLAEAFSVTIQRMETSFDCYLAPDSFTTAGGLRIDAGTISAIRWSLTGIVDGRPLIVINHITRAGNDAGPEWPRIGTDGGYRIEIDGYPPFRGDFPMGLPGGTGSTFADAMAMTAARCVNSVETVVNGPVGYHTFLSLPMVGGKHTLRNS
jgi:2,4-diaminopentanoate dehydrogenase